MDTADGILSIGNDDLANRMDTADGRHDARVSGGKLGVKLG
jgi:hypothetical protein